MRGSFEKHDNQWWSFWGLVFAANDDRSIVYSLEVNHEGDWAITKRVGYLYPGPNHPFENETRIHIEDWTGKYPRWPAKMGYDANTLKVEIASNEVKCYINGHLVYTIQEPAIVNEINALKRVGIIGGDWEIAPTQIGYDYFFLDEGCDTY
jgi:hypothetical protein